MQRVEFEIFADYFQFYLMDAQVSPRMPEDWTDADVSNRLKAAPNLIVVCPVRNMDVPVIVEVREDEPPDSLDDWDHVAECSIEIPSGRLLIDECTGSQVANLSVEPGCYRARSFYGGLDTLDGSGLEGDDHYKVVLWPGTPAEVCVLKQWVEDCGG